MKKKQTIILIIFIVFFSFPSSSLSKCKLCVRECILCVYINLCVCFYFIFDYICLTTLPHRWAYARWLCLVIHRINSYPLVANTIPYCTISNNLYACVIFTEVSIKLLLRKLSACACNPHSISQYQWLWYAILSVHRHKFLPCILYI